MIGTVKGDVHDIGKNLVDIILTNNGYEVTNLGIKVPITEFIERATEIGADAIGMSGLLVKSTLIMRENLEDLNARALSHIPVILGGAAPATTSSGTCGRYMRDGCSRQRPCRLADDTRMAERMRFAFPRQQKDRHLCIADFFRSADSGEADDAAFHVVTMGQVASEHSARLFDANRYQEYLFAHGLSVEMAEALAEHWHRRIREESPRGPGGPVVLGRRRLVRLLDRDHPSRAPPPLTGLRAHCATM